MIQRSLLSLSSTKWGIGKSTLIFFFFSQFPYILNTVFNPELHHLLFLFQYHSLKLYGWFFLFQSVPFTKCMSRLLFHASFHVACCTKISNVSLASLLILLHCRFSEAFLCTICLFPFVLLQHHRCCLNWTQLLQIVLISPFSICMLKVTWFKNECME